MIRTAWGDIASRRDAFHLIVGRLDNSFEGGESNKMQRLRF